MKELGVEESSDVRRPILAMPRRALVRGPVRGPAASKATPKTSGSLVLASPRAACMISLLVVEAPDQGRMDGMDRADPTPSVLMREGSPGAAPCYLAATTPPCTRTTQRHDSSLLMLGFVYA